MKKSPFENRDLTKQLLFPNISWSCISSWQYAKKQNKLDEWYNQYVLGIKVKPNATMLAGIHIGEQLATDLTFLPEVPRPQIYEYSMKGKLGKINLIGHLDGWSAYKKELLEYKTSVRDNRWTQEEVDNWGQITFYCLLLWLNHKINPVEIKIKLIVIPTDEHGDFSVKLSKERPIKIFETNRTMKDILLFCSVIKNIYKEMCEYVEKRKC